MRNYVVRRLALFLPTLLFASIVIFMLMRIAPGDVAAAILRDEATPESLATLRAQLGLDRPLPVQYLDWLGGILRFDLGNSMLYKGHKISGLIGDAFPITLHMTVWGIIIMLILSIPVGLYSALRRNSPGEYLLRFLSIGGLSIPTFWLGIIVLFLLLRFLGWAPEFHYVSFFQNPGENFKAFVIPATVFAYHYAAVVARMLRSQMLEVIRDDYVRTARAKGLTDNLVAYRHAFPNALLPVVTLIGSQFATMLSGLVVVENIFALPGLGTLMVVAAVNRDFVIVQSLTLFIALIVLMVNLVIDLLYSWLDPRVRLA
jgi:peptide/nickel transport system permease protein